MNAKEDSYCADCGGYDVEWMHYCKEHKAHYCRGCDCPECEREEMMEVELDDSWFFDGNGKPY